MAKKAMTKSAAPATTSAVPASTDAAAVATPMETTKPRAATTTTAVMPDPPAVTDQMIADRAYFLWQNGEPGDHHAHWVRSERELRGNG